MEWALAEAWVLIRFGGLIRLDLILCGWLGLLGCCLVYFICFWVFWWGDYVGILVVLFFS